MENSHGPNQLTVKAKPQVAFTLDVYSHIIEGMQEEAMNLLDEVLPAGVSKTNSTNLV